jgi:hypothetical protein
VDTQQDLFSDELIDHPLYQVFRDALFLEIKGHPMPGSPVLEQRRMRELTYIANDIRRARLERR